MYVKERKVAEIQKKPQNHKVFLSLYYQRKIKKIIFFGAIDFPVP